VDSTLEVSMGLGEFMECLCRMGMQLFAGSEMVDLELERKLLFVLEDVLLVFGDQPVIVD
jgi:hypothetical protein